MNGNNDMVFSDRQQPLRPGATAGQFEFEQPGNVEDSEPDGGEQSNDLDQISIQLSEADNSEEMAGAQAMAAPVPFDPQDEKQNSSLQQDE